MSVPVFIGSGVSLDNVADYYERSDGVLIGEVDFKVDRVAAKEAARGTCARRMAAVAQEVQLFSGRKESKLENSMGNQKHRNRGSTRGSRVLSLALARDNRVLEKLSVLPNNPAISL